MIIPKLKGGLGNQMFQIAAAYAAAKRLNTEYGIDSKLQWTGGQEGCSHLKYLDNIFKNVPRSTYTDEFSLYSEPHFHYAPIPECGDTLIDGYFQSDKYFSEYSDDIKSLFYFDDDIKDRVDKKCKQVKKHFNASKLVCIHVRRGEYLMPGYSHVHIAQSLEYYIKAMNMFDDVAFIVISDDIKWCQSNLNFGNVAFCNSGYDYNTRARPHEDKYIEVFDLYLSTRCDHNIISPSSFSWWGAWLNSNKPKVIAPTVWFGVGGPQDYYDIYCSSWEKL